MTSGYSGKVTYRKLGLKPEMAVAVDYPPVDYPDLIGWPGELAFPRTGEPAGLDFIHGFFYQQSDLAHWLPQARSRIRPAGMIWVSWPKRASGVPTDLTEGRIRQLALSLDLVDVKVCAVDETWSGLKLVIPRASRP